LWDAKPNLQTAAAAWIYAGGPHHTGFSQSVTTEQIEMFAEWAGIELLVIDNDTKLRDFKNQIRWNEAHYRLSGSF
jgi:L-arabinose isomerase